MNWQTITHLGSASLMLPMLVLILFGVVASGQSRAMRFWIFSLLVASVLVLASKVAFLGWGLGIEACDFTGISGHATLSAVVLPVWLGWVLARGGEERISRVGIILGLALSGLVCWSRVVLDAHSVSEVVVGWLTGVCTTWLAYRGLDAQLKVPWQTKAAGIFLLLTLSKALSSYLPSYKWEVDLALALSGRHSPHLRRELLLPKYESKHSETA